MQFASAGPKSQIVDLSVYTSGNSPTVFGIVGPATKGELNKAVLCTSPSDFIKKFGEPLSQSYPALAAIETLKQANKVYFVRIANSNVAKASATILEGVENFLTFEAITEGTWANNRLSIEITDVNVKECTVKVVYDGSVVEKYKVSVDSNASNYIETEINSVSEYITVLDEKNGQATSAPTAQTVTLDGGNDGADSLTPSDYIGTTGGCQVFRQIGLEVDVLCAPGAEIEVFQELVSIAETRGDCIVVIDPPNGLTYNDVLDWSNGTGAFSGNPVFNSMHAAIYWPWIINYNDTYNKATYDVPPSVYVLGQYAYTDREYNYWWAPAGVKRGRLTSAAGVKEIVDKSVMDALYDGTNVVNPIAHMPGEGVIIWGQKTTQRTFTSTNRINVARLIMKVRRIVENQSRMFTFDQNDENTWDLWKGAIEPLFAEIKAARGLYDYRVIMDETTVTPEHQDRLEMPGKIFIKPTRAAEYIPISFVISPSGVKFE